MELRELYILQQTLDEVIMDNYCDRKQEPREWLNEQDMLSKRLLALVVEVAELANATRCFKDWSIKGPEEKEVILEEYVDVLHFFLSIGLMLGFTSEEVGRAYLKKNRENYKRQEEGY